MPSNDQIKEALLIRNIENIFLELFSQGKLNGTVHTSVGQEFSAVAFAGQLRETDFVFSNHRCHGHYLSFTKDPKGLIAELLGKKSGSCGGVGSSQHLKHGNFFSNGVQGGITPVGAGLALANKLRGSGHIGVVFIGDGTLGEGVVYEALNLISLWNLPLLVVCENNLYAQSTKLEDNLAGDIRKRAESFGISSFESTTDDVDALLEDARTSIDLVRLQRSPVFHLVNTYRLNSHSKGDDNRDPKEIERFRQRDFLVLLEASDPELYSSLQEASLGQTRALVASVEAEEQLAIEDYLKPIGLPASEPLWSPLETISDRQVTLINRFFYSWLQESSENVFLGEDVLSPYGGAFKVANGLSESFPQQVLSTPISEAAVTGIANGLALGGFRPTVEIMFGDFITLALDQIINHASKFFHMYNRQVRCPIVIRTPMGGGRGYGPTHSQTLDRFLIGIDNVTTVALNTLVNPEIIYRAVFKQEHPVIVIENKVDYGKTIGMPGVKKYTAKMSSDLFPVVRITPESSRATVTIVTYGGMAGIVLDSLQLLFNNYDLKCDVLVLSCINPIDYRSIIESVSVTKRLVVIEEGSKIGGFASEIISSVAELMHVPFETLKIGAEPVPIPSARHLEDKVLPTRITISNSIGLRFG